MRNYCDKHCRGFAVCRESLAQQSGISKCRISSTYTGSSSDNVGALFCLCLMSEPHLGLLKFLPAIWTDKLFSAAVTRKVFLSEMLLCLLLPDGCALQMPPIVPAELLHRADAVNCLLPSRKLRFPVWEAELPSFSRSSKSFKCLIMACRANSPHAAAQTPACCSPNSYTDTHSP